MSRALDHDERALLRALDMLETARDLIQREAQTFEKASEDDRRLAYEYERTAALYRRRAARRPDDAEELSRRAEWFENRARVKRLGEPMPRELRTPAETLGVVDQFRHTLAAALATAYELSHSDVRAFHRCVAQPSPDEELDFELDAFLASALRLLAGLGAVRRQDGAFDVAPYDMPLADSGALSRTDRS